MDPAGGMNHNSSRCWLTIGGCLNGRKNFVEKIHQKNWSKKYFVEKIHQKNWSKNYFVEKIHQKIEKTIDWKNISSTKIAREKQFVLKNHQKLDQ